MIGTTLSHYRILRRLGEGGMGQVYEAEDTWASTTLDRAMRRILPSWSRALSESMGLQGLIQWVDPQLKR